ncbi:hypothetical protein [Flaviaesturariibacter amylovorans]|uniref:TerB family tellurite resistance protein n=1 Tax=Flaviaesturariibacter amylovorans TaxID=1084520 RepID=A0ABP8HIH2_9BACT
MKKILTLCLSFFLLNTLHAQTFNEWFRQKKTKIRYLVEQIAALKAYTGVVDKGYSLAQTGLTTISSIKKGDLALHEDHFASLRAVSPAVRSYWKVGACRTLEQDILSIVHNTERFLGQSSLLKPKEKAFARIVLQRMMEHKTQLMDDLLQVTTDGRTTRSDAERIAQVDSYYHSLTELKEAVLEFGNTLRTLQAQRTQDQRNTQAASRLHGR